jgi:dienelactone hydrolase
MLPHFSSSLRRPTLAVSLCASALFLISCGGGGSEEAESTSRNSTQSLNFDLPPTQEKVSFANSDGLVLTNNTLYHQGPITQGMSAVIMLHGCSGATSSLYTNWAATLTDAGYLVLMVDSFTARDAKNECNNGQAGVSEALDRPKDALAGYDFLVSRHGVHPDRVALLGWSHGGSAALATLWDGQSRKVFAGGVAFYAGCNMYGEIAGGAYPYAPIAMHHGVADTHTSITYCQTLDNNELSKRRRDNISLTAYPGVGHSFDNASRSCNASSVCTYGTADGRALTEGDWNAKQSADAAAMQTIKSLLPL